MCDKILKCTYFKNVGHAYNYRKMQVLKLIKWHVYIYICTKSAKIYENHLRKCEKMHQQLLYNMYINMNSNFIFDRLCSGIL